MPWTTGISSSSGKRTLSMTEDTGSALDPTVLGCVQDVQEPEGTIMDSVELEEALATLTDDLFGGCLEGIFCMSYDVNDRTQHQCSSLGGSALMLPAQSESSENPMAGRIGNSKRAAVGPDREWSKVSVEETSSQLSETEEFEPRFLIQALVSESNPQGLAQMTVHQSAASGKNHVRRRRAKHS
ncbi:hypothetical protein FVE85_1091 [Porphyridium purpureum]|uniref:Uncharacterized protein n=1 Tax=Porphyridium purpureum TaxID=35688 RepID=A0A5J4Z2I4_PORPP|nr:hypothetical protein FVE85_1091 [Porphyridium purpureum]|eukprot:POR5450..scf208_2